MMRSFECPPALSIDASTTDAVFGEETVENGWIVAAVAVDECDPPCDDGVTEEAESALLVSSVVTGGVELLANFVDEKDVGSGHFPDQTSKPGG